MRSPSRLGVLVAFGATALLAACGGNRDHGVADTAAIAAGTAGTAPAGAGGPMTPADSSQMPSSPNPASTARMTDPEIVTLTQAADQGEIETSQLASTKATDPEVRQFANQMRKEHATLIQQRNATIKAQNIEPAAGAKDSINAAGQNMMSALQSAPKGMTFDTAYINGQVMAHSATLAMVQKARNEAQNAALKDLLAKAEPEIQQHLNEAKTIQTKLEGGAR